MQIPEFEIGKQFSCGGNIFLCTDVGSRTVIAIRVDNVPDVSWLSGPPYALAEDVFDENDREGCRPL